MTVARTHQTDRYGKARFPQFDTVVQLFEVDSRCGEDIRAAFLSLSATDQETLEKGLKELTDSQLSDLVMGDESGDPGPTEALLDERARMLFREIVQLVF